MQNNDEFLKRLEALDKEFKNLSHKTTVKKDQVVSFGSIKMDKESGVKGAIYGKTYEIIGWESCIDENTYLKFIVVNPKTGIVQDCKGQTIKNLYKRFHNRSEKTKNSGLLS